MLPAEFGLHKAIHVEPKRRAYYLALANRGGPDVVANMRLAYLTALTGYLGMLAEHRYAVPHLEEPSYARAFREAIAAERRWAAAELGSIGGDDGGPG